MNNIINKERKTAPQSDDPMIDVVLSMFTLYSLKFSSRRDGRTPVLNCKVVVIIDGTHTAAL